MKKVESMDQLLILVDKKDKILGYAPRNKCHTGNGKRHRAFTILLYNKNKQLLLQKRKHWLWDNYWDLTGASHPLHLTNRNETYNEAANRCVNVEWGVKNIRFRKIGAFNYFKRYDSSCENEHCALLIGKYDGSLRPNSKTAYYFRWVSLKELLNEIKKHPNAFTPWAKLAVKLLRKHPFGKKLLD